MPAPIRTPVVAIPAGATGLSASVYIGPTEILGYQIGANWQTADISLQASADGVTFGEVLKSSDASALDLKASANGYFSLSPALRIGPYIIIRSGTSGSAVNQTSGATVTLILRALSGLANE